MRLRRGIIGVLGEDAGAENGTNGLLRRNIYEKVYRMTSKRIPETLMKRTR
jgi:hypothetical protein